MTTAIAETRRSAATAHPSTPRRRRIGLAAAGVAVLTAVSAVVFIAIRVDVRVRAEQGARALLLQLGEHLPAGTVRPSAGGRVEEGYPPGRVLLIDRAVFGGVDVWAVQESTRAALETGWQFDDGPCWPGGACFARPGGGWLLVRPEVSYCWEAPCAVKLHLTYPQPKLWSTAPSPV